MRSRVKQKAFDLSDSKKRLTFAFLTTQGYFVIGGGCAKIILLSQDMKNLMPAVRCLSYNYSGILVEHESREYLYVSQFDTIVKYEVLKKPEWYKNKRGNLKRLYLKELTTIRGLQFSCIWRMLQKMKDYIFCFDSRKDLFILCIKTD